MAGILALRARLTIRAVRSGFAPFTRQPFASQLPLSSQPGLSGVALSS